MDQNSNDEIDLFVVFDKIKNVFKGWIVSLFNAIDFIVKKWVIILILIIVGAISGYFSQSYYKPDQKATALIKVNFDTVDYVYSEIETLNEKLKDTVFLQLNGFRTDSVELKEIEIFPIINLREILEKYELNDRKLEGLLRYLDFDDDEMKLYETFNSEYKYHKIEFSLTDIANKETISKTINYLNSNELLNQLKDTIVKDIKTQIENNKKSIKQIDKVIDNYHSEKLLTSPSDQIFVVDKNFSIHVLFERKLELQELNESLGKFLVYAKSIVVIVNKPNILTNKKGLLNNKITFYPIILVFIFLFLAYTRYVYKKLRTIAKNHKD